MPMIATTIISSIKVKPCCATRFISSSGGLERGMLLDADGTHHLQVGEAHHDFFHAVHLQSAHACRHCGNEDFRYARTLLDQLLDVVVGDQQFVQTDAALVPRLV